MENYNLTAEIKKISGAINNSSPNTELGNINSGVGNLDTAMQGVSNAINNLNIPDPSTSIGEVAQAITNKTIPDPSSNITAVANAIIAMAGGKDLDDLIAILNTMNGNIANLGSNHIVNILESPSVGYQVWYGNGNMVPLGNQASKTSYTDTNNIGATDVQGAVDFFGSYSEGDATLNTSYLSGQARWQKMGKLVTLFYEVTVNANLPTSGWDTKLITNLPAIHTPFSNVRRWSTPSDITSKPPLVFAATNSSGYETTTLYNWGNGSGNTGGTYRGGLEYFTF